MTKSEIRGEALKLPAEERLELAQDLWDSLAEPSDAPPLHEWQRSILDERLAAAEANPDGWLSWDEVKAKVLSSLAHQPKA